MHENYLAELRAHRGRLLDDGAYHAELHASELSATYPAEWIMFDAFDVAEGAKPSIGAEPLFFAAWVMLRLALWLGLPLAIVAAGIWLFGGALP